MARRKNDGYKIIFRASIRRNGKVIRPKKAKAFPIKVRVKKKR